MGGGRQIECKSLLQGVPKSGDFGYVGLVTFEACAHAHAALAGPPWL